MARQHRPVRLVRLVILAGVAAAMWAAAGNADEIQLRRGGRITGVVIERTDKSVTIATGPGQVTLPLAVVERIIEGRSALAVFLERANALSSDDVKGWAALARWAESQALETQAREAWGRVLTLDPQNAEANAALGGVLVDGTWMSREEAYRAQGLVPFEGRWVSPAEQESLLEQRAAAERQRREAEARIREAEARARQAEAEARAREAEAESHASDDGLPVWSGWSAGGYGYGYGSSGYGYGDGYGYGGGHGGHGRGHRDDHGDRGDEPLPRPEPTPTPTPPASMGPLPQTPPPQAHPVGVRPSMH